MTSGPAMFTVGGETLSWLLQGGVSERAGVLRRFGMRWQSYWFDYNLSLQRKLSPGMWQGDNPLFIMGLWRSGTTFMHELLGGCPEMIWPNTWQCMNPSSAARCPSGMGAKSVVRPMDAFSIDTYSPQEDEFALLALGVPSVYRAFIDPGRLSEAAKWLDPGFWAAESGGWMKTWRQFLGWVAGGREGRMLLKSPNHTFRIGRLFGEFPRASYVWMVRNPYDTYLSNRKMWSSMFSHYALRNWRESELDSFIEVSFRRAAECLSSATRSLPPDRLVVVDFDSFMGVPALTAETICKRLNLDASGSIDRFAAMEAANKLLYRGNSHADRALPQELIPAAKTLDSVQVSAICSHGV